MLVSNCYIWQPTVAQIIFLTLIVAWSIVWKILALWVAARKKHDIWFLVLFFVNTVGILEIIYLFGVSKAKKGDILDKPKKKKK